MNPLARILVPGLTLALTAAACAQTTTNDDAEVPSPTGATAPPVDDATTDTAGQSDDAVVDTAVDAESEDAPAATEAPADTTPVTEPPATDPPATDPPATDPPVTEPPATPPPTSDPFGGVATFYAGTGFADQPWAPIGWWDGSAWQEPTFDADGFLVPAPPPALTTVSATSLDLGDGDGAVIDGLVLGPETEYCVGEETGPIIDLGRDVPDTPASLGYDVVAATVDWPLQPRPVRQVGLEAPIYSEVGAQLFSNVPDAAATGEVIQVVRVDLDGDSIEEVLVTFENITSDFGAAGDFTGVYARYPAADGSVVDDFVAAYVPAEPDGFPTFGRHTIAGVADLNGDGVMEVIVRDSFWEYGGMTVYALQDGRLVSVAGGGCGV